MVPETYNGPVSLIRGRFPWHKSAVALKQSAERVNGVARWQRSFQGRHPGAHQRCKHSSRRDCAAATPSIIHRARNPRPCPNKPELANSNTPTGAHFQYENEKKPCRRPIDEADGNAGITGFIMQRKKRIKSIEVG